MAKKKATKPKVKAVWGWVQTTPKVSVSSLNKPSIENTFQDLINTIRETNAKEQNAENDLKLEHYLIDIASKWHKNYFYIYGIYRDVRPNRFGDSYTYEIARLECLSDTTFSLAYFRHTGQWEKLFNCENISAQDAKTAILEDDFFQIF